MKVFLSWSGRRSELVAELLSQWLPCVIQSIEPWISSRDIDRGALWFGELGNRLSEISIGIICLTQENKERPWILFEAGALAKGLPKSRVCTLLVDLEHSDVKDPLAQFNHTRPDENSVFKLVRTLNSALGTSALPDKILVPVFDKWWSTFAEQFAAVLTQTQNAPLPEPRQSDDVLAEILENTRSIGARVRRLEQVQEYEGGNTAVKFSPTLQNRLLQLLERELRKVDVDLRHAQFVGQEIKATVEDDPPSLAKESLTAYMAAKGYKLTFELKRK